MPQDLRSFSRELGRKYTAPSGAGQPSGPVGPAAPAPQPSPPQGGAPQSAQSQLPAQRGSYLPQQPLQVTLNQPPPPPPPLPSPPPQEPSTGTPTDGITTDPAQTGLTTLPQDFSFTQPGTQFGMAPPTAGGVGPAPADLLGQYQDPANAPYGGEAGYGGGGGEQTIPPDATEPDSGWRDLLEDDPSLSWDPIQQGIESQMETALRRLYEQMAGRGMGASGAQGAMAGGIMRGFSQDMATQHQEWIQQQIQNNMQKASMIMQDDWHLMDLQQQEVMAKLMFELDRRRMFGDDYDPNVGQAEFTMAMALLQNPELSRQGKEMLEGILRDIYGDEKVDEWMGGGGGAGAYTGSGVLPGGLDWLGKQAGDQAEK